MKLYNKFYLLCAILSGQDAFEVDLVELVNGIIGSVSGVVTANQGHLVFENFFESSNKHKKICSSFCISVVNTALAFTFYILAPKTLFFAAIAYLSAVGLGFILEMAFKQANGNFKFFAFELPWYQVLKKHAFFGISTFFSFSGAFLCPKLFSAFYGPFFFGFLALSGILALVLVAQQRQGETGFTNELKNRKSIVKLEFMFAVLYAVTPLKHFSPLAFVSFVFLTQFAKNYSCYLFKNLEFPFFIFLQSLTLLGMACVYFIFSSPMFFLDILLLILRIFVFL